MQLCQILHEVQFGSCTHARARDLRENGGWGTVMILALDAMSVYSAVTAANVKEPSEKALYNHVLYLRELLDIGVLHALWWIDTRDMTADGLTKGAVDRTVLHAVMQGLTIVTHPYQEWRSRLAIRAQSKM